MLRHNKWNQTDVDLKYNISRIGIVVNPVLPALTIYHRRLNIFLLHCPLNRNIFLCHGSRDQHDQRMV